MTKIKNILYTAFSLLLACHSTALLAQTAGLFWPAYEGAIKEAYDSGQLNSEEGFHAFNKKWINAFKERLTQISSDNPEYYKVLNEMLLMLRDEKNYEEAFKYSNMLLESGNDFWNKKSALTKATNLQIMGLLYKQKGIYAEDVFARIGETLDECKNSKYSDGIDEELHLCRMMIEILDLFNEDGAQNEQKIKIYEYMLNRILSLSNAQYGEHALEGLTSGSRAFSADDYAQKLIELYPDDKKNELFKSLNDNPRIDKIILGYGLQKNSSNKADATYSEFLSKSMSSAELNPYNLLQYIGVINGVKDMGYSSDALVLASRILEKFGDATDQPEAGNLTKDSILQIKNIKQSIIKEL